MNRRQFLKQTVAAGTALALPSSLSDPAHSTPKTIQDFRSYVDAVDAARRLRVFVLEHGELWDVRRVVDVVVRANANTLRCDVGVFRGLVTMFPSKILPLHPRLQGRDCLREMLDECERREVLLFPYNAFYGYLSPEVLELHRDWAVLTRDGRRVSYACQNHPGYVAAYAGVCRELVTQYNVAGMYFDGPGELLNQERVGSDVEHTYCYCDYCQKVAVELGGGHMRAEPNREADPEFRTLLLAVHMEGMRRFMAETRHAIKSVRNLPVIMNMCDPPIRFVRFGAMREADGGLVAEIHRNTTYLDALLRVRVGSAFGKAAWCYCPIGPHEKLVTYDDLETRIFGLTQLAHGGTPIVETLQSFLYDTTGLSAVNSLFTHMARHEDLYATFQSVPSLAILSSEQSGRRVSAWDLRTRLGHWRNDHVRGAFACAVHTHQQHDVILDEHLEPRFLSRFHALFLPNAACLSDAQATVIREFVRAGGGLIATHETSLYDEQGGRRANFALADVFGVSYRGSHTQPSSDWQRPYLRVMRDHAVTNGLGTDRLIAYTAYDPVRQPLTLVQRTAGETLADVYFSTGQERGEPLDFSRTLPSLVVAHSFGQGRCLYLGPGLDLLYYRREFSIVRRLLDNAFLWASRGQRPFRLTAPNCVVAHLTEAGQERALHLVNYVGDMRENGQAKVEWVAPLRDLVLEVRAPAGKQLVGARLTIGQSDLPFSRQGDHWRLTIPELNEYECVRLRYEA